MCPAKLWSRSALGLSSIMNIRSKRDKIGDGKSNINDLFFADGSDAVNTIDAGNLSDIMDTNDNAIILDSGSISNFI